MSERRTSNVFGPIVRSLVDGAPVTLEHVDLLQSRLVGVLRARGLLARPPRFLGYSDLERWTEDSLRLLAFEAFEWAILRKLDALHAKQDVFETIDGLVIRNLRNFVGHLQAKADPFGDAVYRNLRSSAASGLDEGWLASPVEDNPPGPEQALHAPGRPTAMPFDAGALEVEIDRDERWRNWAFELGAIGGPGRRAATAALTDLIEREVMPFSLGPITNCIAPACRKERASRLASDDFAVDDTFDGQILRVPITYTQFDAYREWLDFRSSVEAAIRRARTHEKRRERLQELWRTIATLVDEGAEEEIRHRELMGHMRVARSTLSDDLRALSGIIEDVTAGEVGDGRVTVSSRSECER